jgi:hypothetical protein
MISHVEDQVALAITRVILRVPLVRPKPALIRSRVNAGAKIGRPKERAAQGSGR